MSTPGTPGTLTNSEDQKLFTLASASMQRNKVLQSAGLRDGTGRTHVGNSIALAKLELDALQVALAMALSSGAEVIEAAVVVDVAGVLAIVIPGLVHIPMVAVDVDEGHHNALSTPRTMSK